MLAVLALLESCYCDEDYNFSSVDSSSFSNLDEVRTKSYEINSTIDFDRKVISSVVTYEFQVFKKTDQIILDIAGLKINKVYVAGTRFFEEVNFTVNYPARYRQLGGYLNVTLAKNRTILDGRVIMRILCDTTNTYPDVSAFTWLDPAQTAGKKKPYLYTQSESIYGRSLFPCQDSPSIKANFTSEIISPPGTRAFVSGLLTYYKPFATHVVQQFTQKNPIPAYLFAIVAGNIDKVYLDKRIAVITQPVQMTASLNQLTDMPKYLEALENATYDYEWTEYSIVILPPSFPFGGMQNPHVTFASPSIIVGDKSNTNVVIHEMAHSWTGNLVTCKNWNSFWLNEGYTVFLENKVNRQLYGEQLYNITGYLQQGELNATILDYGVTNNYTSLFPNVQNYNPDDAFSSIPYDKGYQFLTSIERLVGIKFFEEFTKHYLTKYKFKSIETPDLKATMKEYFELRGRTLEFGKIKWDEWTNRTGFSPEHLVFTSTALTNLFALVAQFKSNDPRFDIDFPPLLKNRTIQSTKLLTLFFSLINDGTVNPDKARAFDTKYGISNSLNNFQTLTNWFLYCLGNKDSDVIDDANAKVLSKIGRMKFIRPIYKAIKAIDSQRAISIFNQNQAFYHPIAVTQIKKDLGLTQERTVPLSKVGMRLRRFTQ